MAYSKYHVQSSVVDCSFTTGQESSSMLKGEVVTLEELLQLRDKLLKQNENLK